MSQSAREQEAASPDQLIRLFRSRPRAGNKKKLRQRDLAALVGVETRTLQLWESGESLPGPDNLQRLIQIFLTEHLFLPAEEEQEGRRLWEAVAQTYDTRPGTYRLFPPFDAHWFRHLLHMSAARQQIRLEAGQDPRTNLRPHSTSFIGRDTDLAEVKRLLAQTHFVTLTGAGGCGKTRLAQRVGEEVLERYVDGIWLVELATLTDAALLPGLIATTLALQEQPGHTLLETLIAVSQNKQMLLILDNCEHLVHACASVAEQLRSACPSLALLVTSRETLNVEGEAIWRVAPLTVPTRSARAVNALQIEQVEAVQLFLARARLLLPHFELTDQNAPLIASICQQLDGIPLALELAAARMNVLSLEQLAARLEDRFRLLTTGRRTALPRHQTLRATLDWSYESLSAKEQMLFRRLSVFSGAFSLEAMEAICAWPATEDGPAGTTLATEEMLDLLAQLVNKSLVLTTSAHSATDLPPLRYRLLETMKHYGQERSEELEKHCTRELQLLQAHHAQYYLELVEQAGHHLRSSRREIWLAQLRADEENLRGVLAWSLTSQGEPTIGLRIAGVLYWFWYHEGNWREGRSWLEKLLAQVSRPAENVPLARAVHGLSVLVWAQGERQLAEHLAREAVVLARRCGDDAMLATTLRLLVQVELSQGKNQAARELAEEGVQLARRLEDHWNLASSLNILGTVLQVQRNDMQAEQIYQESLRTFEETGDRWEQTAPLRNLGHLALEKGAYEQAASFYLRSIALCRGMRGTWLLTRGLEGLARVVCAQGNFTRAVTLLAAAEKQRAALGAVVLPAQRADYDYTLSVLCTSLGPQAFEEAWHPGSLMSAEQSMAYALGD